MLLPRISVVGGLPGARRAHLGAVVARTATLLALLAAPPAPAAVPLEVYGRLPRLENVALSPDGSRVAFIKTEGDTRVAAVVSLADRQMLGGVRLGNRKLRSIRWADNNRLMLITSVTTVPNGFMGSRSEWSQLQIYDVGTGKQYPVPRADTFRGVDVLDTIIGRPMVRHLQGRTVLFVRGVMSVPEAAPALIRIDLDTQASRVLRPGSPGNLGWIVGDDGEVVAEESYDEHEHRWSIFIRRAGHMQEAAGGHEELEFPELLGGGPEADTLLLRQLEQGEWVWRLLSLKDGSIGPPLAGSLELDAPIEDAVTHRLIGGVRVEDSTQYVFFDPHRQSVWDAIVRTFSGERVQFVSASEDFRRIVVRVEGVRDGLRYQLIDLGTHEASVLGNVYDGISSPYPVTRITYPAADGTQIPAYLTLPGQRLPTSLPLIVLPHGGPAARATADFDWWAQALVGQGYAVLQPNYRGSNLGRRFLEAGFGEWGRKMQTDLSDGVRYLAREGQIDPTRVCIVGGSYGGYAALAGAAIDSGVYRCAVAVAGISDLRRMLRWEIDRAGRDDSWTQRYWDRYLGVRGPEDAALETISPLRHVKAVSVPVLLVHGRDDTVVPYEQSQLMYDALHAAGKDVQLVTLKEEDHWLSRSATRLQMLQATVAFLRVHNPPD